MRLLGREAPRGYEFAARAREKLRIVVTDRLPRPQPNVRQPALDASALQEALADLGVEPGDTLMVASSWEHASAVAASPVALVQTLLGLLGPEGTLCMPAYPVLLPGAAFDLRRTPSRAGLVTEIFRRMPGVRRSAQLSSVAAVGPRADELLGQHHLSPYASGPLSPHAKIAETGGKVLCLGVGAEYNTLLHCAEDFLQKDFPAPVYEDGLRDIEVVHDDGTRSQVQAYQRAARWQYCADGVRLMKYFEDLLSRRSIASKEASLVAADAFLERVLLLAERGIHMYGFRFPPVTRTLSAVPRAGGQGRQSGPRG